MKVKKDYILREVAGTNVVLPVGKATVNFNGMLTLNDSGVMLWKLLEEDTSAEALAEMLCTQYDVSEETARKDVEEFLDILKKADCLEV